MINLEGRRIAFLSHEVEGATGFPAAFAIYLKKAQADLAYVKFPFAMSDTKSIWVEKYRGETRIYKSQSWIRFFKPELVSYAKDMLWLFTVGWRHVAGAEFVLASNNLLGLGALVLRKLGLVSKFAYLIVDYSPIRFSNPWVERLYIYLDRLVATSADSVWTMSMPMLEAREHAGRLKMAEVRWRLAPMGNNADVIFANGDVPHDPRLLMYVGNTKATNVRPDFLLDVAFQLKKAGETFSLVYVGPGSTDHLVEKARTLGIEEYVRFRGTIPEAIDLERYLAGGGIGLAPYDPHLKNNFSRYADPAKIKTYLGCGLPVLSTDVPSIAQELESRGAGFVTEFTPEAFATNIQKLWNDPKLYDQMRRSAIEMGLEYSWSRIFDRLVRDEGLQQEITIPDRR